MLISASGFIKQKKIPASLAYRAFGGERGIRTPGGVTLNGFQDRRIRPLCHLSKCVCYECLSQSGCKYNKTFFNYPNYKSIIFVVFKMLSKFSRSLMSLASPLIQRISAGFNLEL